ncbi:MAG: hypothetical protein OEY49_20510 [Candidatus Heimdallarchaeota archaeon]|nr:hypothetical protein [Candidatus Heimdallarchaeota archaeon]
MKKILFIYFITTISLMTLLYILLSSLNMFQNQSVLLLWLLQMIILIISGAASVIYLIRYIETRVTPLKFLLISLLSFVIFFIFQSTSILYLNSGNTSLISQAKTIYYFGLIFTGASPIFIITFISSYTRHSVKSYNLIVPAFYFGVHLSYIITDKAIGDPSASSDIIRSFEYTHENIWMNVFGLICFVYTAIFIVREIRFIRAKTIDSKMRNQQLIFGYSTAAAYFLTPFVYGMVSAFDSDLMQVFWVYFISPSFIVLMIIIGNIPYIINRQVAYLQPQLIDKIIIVKKDGTPLFSYDFNIIRSYSSNTSDVLFSGVMTTISSILQEATGISSNIKSINFEDRYLLTNFSSDLAFILITENQSDILLNNLDVFTKRLNQNFNQEITESMNTGRNLDGNEKIISLVRSSFGFN